MRLRVVEHQYGGYCVQIKTWLLPFWRDAGHFSDRFASVEEAEKWARGFVRKVIKEIEL